SVLPTINYLLEHGAAVILMSHWAKHKGKKTLLYTLSPIAERLSELLGRPVAFAYDCTNDKTRQAAANLKSGEVLLLENLRFYDEEEENDPEFAKELASLADIYVNDAFGTAHRAHASTEGITHFLPAVSGLLMNKEIKGMGPAVGEPDRPYVAIIGGAKVSDKIFVIKHLITKVDKLLIGGGMANTFLAAAGYDMQKSLVEEDRLDWARYFLSTDIAKEKLMLPVDLVAAISFSEDALHQVCSVDSMPAGWMALDIGPATVESFVSVIQSAATIFWNGPLGVFEMEPFACGTFAIARAIASSPAYSIIGGGDSVAAVHKAGVAEQISHISTGGGASLGFLGGKILPGIAALDDK
ncbi:MAG: phosphoglycerate kinase, partial [Firmicutes bacterium]|nr:phosphoglycerate kinase [Bacillota bacterium]